MIILRTKLCIIVKVWDSAASFVAVNLLLEEQDGSLSEGQLTSYQEAVGLTCSSPEHEALGRVSMIERTPWPQLRGSGGLPGWLW